MSNDLINFNIFYKNYEKFFDFPFSNTYKHFYNVTFFNK